MGQYYEGLSRFELILILHGSQTLAITYFSLFMTLLFAYLAMAYFAAKQLSRFQVITISAIYSFAIFFTMYGAYGNIHAIGVIRYVLEGMSTTPFTNGIAFTVFMFIAWVVSIIFLVQARRAK